MGQVSSLNLGGDEPGLGVSLNEDLLRSEHYETAYPPVARRRDGTLTDW